MNSTAKTFALVTGASAGLGAEFARQLAAAGHNLILLARREDRLQQLGEELRSAYGARVEVVAEDLSDPAALDRLRATLDANGWQVGYLVNNAGLGGPDFLTDDWPAQRVFYELMMTACAGLCHLVLPGMRERGYGRIINVASVAGRIIRQGDINYGPSKAYLIALTEGLSGLQEEGVSVMALCPGFTHTEFHERPDLAEMKAGTPGFVWYDAEVVVREALNAIERGRTIYTSGRLYRWLDPFLHNVALRPLLRRLASR